jgi:hypothetical protein
MAAQALIIPDLSDRTELWTRLIDELTARVREYNAIAGETVWRISRSTYPHPRIVVDSGSFASCRLDCAFDAERGLIVSAPGFLESCLPFSTRGILYNGKNCGPAKVVAQLLDGLAHAIEE